MTNKNIEISSLTLSKGKNLKGDDFCEIAVINNMTIAIVCDGVGSAKEGALAAKRTSNFLIQSFKTRPRTWSIEKSIKYFIYTINRTLYLESISEYGSEEMVTTLALVIIDNGRLYGANVGDSRIYLHRDKDLLQLSNDHSLSDENMDHILTSAIGLENSISPYYFENNLKSGDKLLLCSDGLYSEMDDSRLSSYMHMGAPFLVKKVSKLYNDDLPDDTTAVVLDINNLELKPNIHQEELLIQHSYKVNSTIDGYLLVKPLIQNQRTWLCKKDNQYYVLKFAPFEANDDENVLDRFVKEVWLSKKIDSSIFPKVNVPKDRTHRYYIMDYIEGVTLKEYIPKKNMSIDLTIELAKFLLNMAQYLLKHDLVHGDIKPENIMIIDNTDHLSFKMIDFGNITELYSDTHKTGTASYIAPERYNYEPITEQTEIYSIGVTLYEVLTNKLPFGEIEPFQMPTFDTLVKEPKTLNINIPNWLNSIILRALEVNTDRRYLNYTEIIYELHNPAKVKPFYNKKISYMERKPLSSCRILLGILVTINIIVLIV